MSMRFSPFWLEKSVKLRQLDPVVSQWLALMYQPQKRSRAMESEVPNSHWRRVVLKLLISIHQAVVGTVTNSLKPKKGMDRLTGIVQELDYLSPLELEQLQVHLEDQMVERQIISESPFVLVSSNEIGSPMSKPNIPVSRGKSSSSSQNAPAMKAPACKCHLDCVLLTARKQNLNFQRQFWRCPKWSSPEERCEFFMWSSEQPNWKPVPNPSVNPENCTHARTTKVVSNGWMSQTKCLDCNTVIERIPKKKSGAKPESQDSDHQLYQQFLEFQKFQKQSKR